MKLEYYAKTDRGLVRSGNEDRYLLLAEKNLFVVCDGMGGHSAGEVASRTAVGTISATFNFESSELVDDSLLDLGTSLPPDASLLVKAIRLANRRIYNRARSDSNLSGMGTTVVASAFEGDLISIVHTGDSRLYLYRDSKLTPLTVDHSWVAEAQAAGNLSSEMAGTLVSKNIITRALGIRESVEVDIRTEKVEEDDIFILCTDGLCSDSTDREIEYVVNSSGDSPKKITDNLIQLALDHGGSDNITIVCIKALDVDQQTIYQPTPAQTIPEENVATGEREDEWLDILAEQNRLEAEEFEEEDAARKSRSFATLAFVILLMIGAVIYYFYEGGL